MENSGAEAKLPLAEYQLKEELRKCYACEDWIETKIHRLNRNGKILYFHAFCFLCITNKNPYYKNLNVSSIKKI